MRDKPINVTEIIYETPEVGGLRQPLLAEAVRDGKKYLVSVSSRTQMTQQVFNAYVQQELGDDELPTITRKAFAYKVVALAPNRRTSNTQELGVRTYQGKTYLMKGGPSDSADALIINPNDPLQLERAQGKYMYVEGNDIRCHIKGRDSTITAAQIVADPDLSSLYTKIKTEQDKGPTRGYSSKFLANAAAELANNQIGVSKDSTGAITIKINQNGAIKSTVISENDMLDPQVQELCRSIESGQLPNITKLLYYTNKQSWTSQVTSNVEKIAIENYELSMGMKGREIPEALTRPSIESNRRELINIALANNLIPGALMDRVPPAGGLETVELDNVGEAKDYALAKIARGKEFIIPITMSAAGGGHTVYIAGVKEGNNYRTTILNQTEQVPPEALAELQNISKAVTTAINNDLRSSGSRVNISQSERTVISGVFPSVEGGAGCQEVGVILVDAIRNGNLQDVIAHCKDINLGPAKLAEVRLNATLAFEQVQLRTGLSMDRKISELTQGEVADAKSRLAIGLRLEPVEMRQQNNLTADRDDARRMLENTGEAITEARIVADAAVITETRKASILNDCLLGATIPSTPENLGYITA